MVQQHTEILAGGLGAVPLGVYCYLLDQADRRPGEEHGSAHWGIAKELNERYRNRKDPWQEIILSQNIRLSNDSYQHQRNLHVVVIGGSGSGKTRFFVKPNALQCSGSYFFLDPKGELTYSLGGAMERNGITVTVIDFVHFRGHYNPVAYLKTDEDAMKLAYALVFNTKRTRHLRRRKNEFWDKSAVMFLASLILYILYESPLYERNLSTMMDMILECKVSEDSYDENRMDILFGELEQRDRITRLCCNTVRSSSAARKPCPALWSRRYPICICCNRRRLPR